MSRRVVITGLGCVTPIGTGKEEVFNALKECKSGIDYITKFDTKDMPVKIAGELKNFNPEIYIDKKEAKRMDSFCQYAMAASKIALEDSKINLNLINKEKLGVIIGSGIGGLSILEEQHQKLLEKGPKRISPFLIPMMIGNMASGNVAIMLGAKGYNTAVVTACASGTHSIGEAFEAIKRGAMDLSFCGGSEAPITPLAISGFASMKALSTRNEEPQKASRPFDKDRDGFVMSEGSAIVVLEELGHAIKRGAKIYAEIVGYGATADAYHMTTPAENGEGAQRAMRMALEEANLKIEDVTYINAHGTSTSYNDRFETQAIKAVFGNHAKDLYVSSTKSSTGHLLGAAGALEAMICALSISEDFIPATINLNEPEEGLDLNYVANKPIYKKVNVALSNSLGFGGHNATLALKKYE